VLWRVKQAKKINQSTLRLNTLGSIYTDTPVRATGVHLEIRRIAVQPSGRSLV
jgi:hypothetical protein